jgi:hypothetical protein
VADDNNAHPDKYEAQLTQAVDYLRGNVKWTLLAFGAIGTTLLAGSQLSSLGKFQVDDPRLWAAFFFAALALGAASYAVRSALAVAYAGRVEFSHLEAADFAFIADNKPILEGYADVDALRDAYNKIIAKRKRDLMTSGTTEKVLASNQHWYEYLDALCDKVLAYIRYNRIWRQVKRSRSELTVASAVAAIALVGFAWAANPGPETQTVVLQSPASPAKLTLSAAGKVALTPLLGAKCVALPAVDVLLLNVTTAGSEVVTVAGKDCPLARFTLTSTMGRFASTGASAGASTGIAPAPAAASAASDQPIIWTQLRPDTAGANGELIARAIVARDAACPPLIANGARWPMATRADGSDPDFAIKMCEAALPGDATAQIGGVTLKPRPHTPRKIVVIGDTGCRITDYTAQACDSGTDWPFFRVAKTASAMNPDLVIHVGDYHYREKPCAGRAGCTDSPSGDNWQTWQADFFAPAAPLLTAAPWVMLRGNHEDCARAGAGWNLLIRPQLGLKPGERCPADTDPALFAFAQLRLVVPDTASAEGAKAASSRIAIRSGHWPGSSEPVPAIRGC